MIDVLKKAIILLTSFYIIPISAFGALFERTEADSSETPTIPHAPPPGIA